MAETATDMETDSILETDILTHEEQAETKKEEGNKYYKTKNYREALRLYSEAIDLSPENAAFYSNRAACYLMLGAYQRALEDSRHATRLDNTFVKGFLREARCLIALGDSASAFRTLETVRLLDSRNPEIEKEMSSIKQLQHFEEEASKAYNKQDYRKVIYCMDRALQHAMACPRFKILKAECLALVGRYQESQEIANDILQSDSMNADAIYVRGMCLYYEDNVDKAFQHFQKVLRLAPDHQKAHEIYRKAKALKLKKEAGNAAFKSGQLNEAYDLYSEALAIDPNNKSTNAKLYFNRATVCSKINKLNQGVEDCSNAIKLDESYVKAYLRRAKCYMDLEMYEEAVRDYEKANKLECTRETKQLLQEAKRELKKSKRKDYYKILGVDKAANDDEIRKAYRKRALIHHPDRHANESDEKKRDQEKKFKEVGEAYGVLSDPQKRARYDNGQDIGDMDGYADMDPNNIFQAFFGGAGGPGHFQFASGPGVNVNSNNFPGGFTFQFG